MKLKVILFGSTGMIGQGVLNECLNDDNVETILVINREACGVVHPKLKEIIHLNIFDLDPISKELTGYNACFFCLGISSAGMIEEEYYTTTYELTIHVATVLLDLNKGITFCYISGAGTDCTERGSIMWARVKGKTENDLMKLPFKKVYNFRPGGIEPFLPLKPSQTFYNTYKYTKWLFSIMKVITPHYIITLKELAAAMINVSVTGYSKNILEMDDMKILAKDQLKK